MGVTDLPHPREVVSRREQHAVRAHHRLEDDRGDAVGSFVLDHLRQVGDRPVGLLLVAGGAERRAVGVRPEEVDDAGDRRLGAPPAGLAGEGHGRGRRAVVAAVRRQHLVAAGVGTGHAQGVLVGLGATVGEEHPVEPVRGVGRDQSRRFVAGLVGERRRHRAQPFRLLDDGGDHLGVLVTEVEVHELRREVEPAVAVVVPHLATGPAGEGHRVDQVLCRPGVEDVGPIGSRYLGVGGGDGIEGHAAILARDEGLWRLGVVAPRGVTNRSARSPSGTGPTRGSRCSSPR